MDNIYIYMVYKYIYMGLYIYMVYIYGIIYIYMCVHLLPFKQPFRWVLCHAPAFLSAAPWRRRCQGSAAA